MVIFLVLRKDSLDKTQVVNAFKSERDAESYISDCKKMDDRYGLCTMKYDYFIQQMMVQ